MQNLDWVKEFGGAVTVCDENGIILSMNEKACRTFSKDGGSALIGRNLFDCHPEKARARLHEIMEKRGTNAYTIEKAGVRKFIYQAPWYKEGVFAGLVELSIEIPAEMPHFVRTPPTAPAAR